VYVHIYHFPFLSFYCPTSFLDYFEDRKNARLLQTLRFPNEKVLFGSRLLARSLRRIRKNDPLAGRGRGCFPGTLPPFPSRPWQAPSWCHVVWRRVLDLRDEGCASSPSFRRSKQAKLSLSHATFSDPRAWIIADPPCFLPADIQRTPDNWWAEECCGWVHARVVVTRVFPRSLSLVVSCKREIGIDRSWSAGDVMATSYTIRKCYVIKLNAGSQTASIARINLYFWFYILSIIFRKHPSGVIIEKIMRHATLAFYSLDWLLLFLSKILILILDCNDN